MTRDSPRFAKAPRTGHGRLQSNESALADAGKRAPGDSAAATEPAILIMAGDAPSRERRRLAGIFVFARFARMPARRRRSQGRPQPVRRIALCQNENHRYRTKREGADRDSMR